MASIFDAKMGYGTNIRLGVVKYGTQVVQEIGLNQYETLEDFHRAVDQMDFLVMLNFIVFDILFLITVLYRCLPYILMFCITYFLNSE